MTTHLTPHLTPRETQLVDCMLQGKRPHVIKKELGLTLSSVNTYQKRLYKKLGVHSAVELIAKIELTKKLELSVRNAELVATLRSEISQQGGSHFVMPLAFVERVIVALEGRSP